MRNVLDYMVTRSLALYPTGGVSRRKRGAANPSTSPLGYSSRDARLVPAPLLAERAPVRPVKAFPADERTERVLGEDIGSGGSRAAVTANQEEGTAGAVPLEDRAH